MAASLPLSLQPTALHKRAVDWLRRRVPYDADSAMFRFQARGLPEPDAVTRRTLLTLARTVGVDSDALYADMEPMMAIYPEININPVALYIDSLDEATGMISVSLNAMLVLAMLAAAFGVLNTVTMNIEERRREIGLLRAVGTTRKQTRRVIVGEAVLLGVIGGTVGFLAGLGVVVVIVMTYGFNSFGVELDLWATVGKSLQPALLTGVVGLIAAPAIAALAAWLPTRNILKSEPVTLIPKSH